MLLALAWLAATDGRRPSRSEESANKIDETGEQLPVHNAWFFYLARICNHCSYPACLAACPRNAIYKRAEDGIVLLDRAECRGYRKCVEACPYKKTRYRGNTRHGRWANGSHDSEVPPS